MSEDLLWRAAREGNAAVCKVLIEQGVNVDSEKEWGALQSACDAGSLEVCKLLIDAGAKVSHLRHGSPPLALAVGRRNVEMCKLLLSAGADANEAEGEHRKTPLDHAAYWRNEQIFRLLLSAGADPNAVDSHGKTLLMRLAVTAKDSSAKMCGILIECGANLDLCDSDGMRAVCLAAAHDNLPVLKLLIDKGADSRALSPNEHALSPFQLAVKNGAVGAAQYLVVHVGVDPAQKSASGRTLVQLAGKNAEMRALVNAIKTSDAVYGSISPSGEAPACKVGLSPL
jgi:ankyrin repeat protein